MTMLPLPNSPKWKIMTEQNPPTDHTFALPQQRLLLELLNMSGEFAVMGS